MQLPRMHVAREVHLADQFRKTVSDRQLSIGDVKIYVKRRLRLNSISETLRTIRRLWPSDLITYIRTTFNRGRENNLLLVFDI